MPSKLRPLWILALIAAGTLICLYSLDRYQHRYVRSDRDLIYLLPGDNATIFYVQANIVRRAGLLNLFAGSETAREPEYESFVSATRFDYAKDIDALAGSVTSDGLFLAVKGRFDWTAIRNYVQRQGGSCTQERCELAASSPGNWIGTVRIQSDVLGIALGQKRSLFTAIHPGQRSLTPPPAEPVWVRLAPGLLKNPSDLPLILRIFAIAMQSASSVTLAAAPANGGADAFQLTLAAQCPSAATADTIRQQLQIDTKMLKLELAHERQEPNAADLTGLLTSGSFDTSGRTVRGSWPVSKELLKTLQK